MTGDERARLILSQEGQWIHIASQHGPEGAELVQCVADGAMNALMRIVGPEGAAEYSYAIADRIVGRVRGVTTLPPALVPVPVVPKIEPAPAPITKSESPKGTLRFWTIFMAGWLCGFIGGYFTR